MSALAASCHECECCRLDSLPAVPRLDAADRLLAVIRDALRPRLARQPQALVDHSAYMERVRQERAREARELAYQRIYFSRF